MAKAGLLYVGTDDGVLVLSNPGGAGRWLQVGHELRSCAVRALQPAADNPLLATAAVVTEGLHRTSTGGQNWNKVLDLDVFVIASHPSAPKTMYIGAEGGDVYRSHNQGIIWEQCPQGDHPANSQITALLVAPDDADKLYLAIEGSGLWSSPDQGTNWEPRARGLPPRVTAVVASQNIPGRLFASAEQIFYRSDTGDKDWAQFPLPGSSEASVLALLPGQEETLLTAVADAIVRSTDQGETWHQTNSDTPWEGAITAISPASYHIDTAFAGTDQGQIAISSDRGRNWKLLKSGLPPIRAIAAERLA